MPEDIKPPDAGDEIHLNANSRSSQLPPKDREAVLAKAREMSGEEPEPAPQPKQQTPPPKAPEQKPDPKAATPPAKPEPEKKDEPKPDDKKPKGVAELRDAYSKATEELRKAQDTIGTSTKEKAELMAKVAQTEEAYAKATERISKELEPQVVKLKETEKRLQEREDALRMKDYTQTQEWQDKYVAPLVNANAKKNRFLQQTTATVPDPQTGEAREVQAQPEHFDYVLGAKTTREAFRRAKETFGDDLAQTAVNIREEILDHAQRQQEGLKNAQLEAVEWQKNQAAFEAQQREAVRNEILSARKSYMDSKPEVFSPKEDDNEMVSALAEGQKFAESLLNPPADLTPAQAFKRVGEANARIMESFALRPHMAKLEAENKALREELEAYHKSEPDVRTRDGGPAPKAPTTKDEEHEAMLKAAHELATSLG